MKLLSHGSDSDLLEHLREVSFAATTLEERIICVCHDAGKATFDWQDYIRGGRIESPHHHAATGGLLASLLIRKINGTDSKFWSLVALHTGSAHHSFIGLNRQNKNEFCYICQDEQAKKFFLDTKSGIASLLPEIDTLAFQSTWDTFRIIAPLNGDKVSEFNQWLSISATERFRAFLKARSILGRLCYQDHESASKQSGTTCNITVWQKAYPDRCFLTRIPKTFSESQKEIHRLRRELKAAFYNSLEDESCFYFIDAPTGLGKTEAMLTGAEKLLLKHNLKRVVFSVPQVSIADQIYDDYFLKKDNVQIWNYIRQEKNIGFAQNEDSNINTEFSLDIALQPFSESYNITTFNQVLLAMCHPHRVRCIKSIGLRDSVIIMDEFHKLPISILPFFFRIAREYANLYNCKFIFGSATPLEEFEYLGLTGSVRILKEITQPLYNSPSVDDRRYYESIGKINIDELGNRIEAFNNSTDKNLLIVLNLVGKGTWPLLQKSYGSYNPWRQIQLLNNDDTGRVTVFLDGLVPPLLRRQIVTDCKKAMQRRPVTLITTQMIEVGVDLDFDHALIDYQGIAATIQRGGRVGREGRDYPCKVEVFSLVSDEETTSFQILNDVLKKNDSRFKDYRFQDVTQKIIRFWQKEIRFFEKWESQIFKDSNLIEGLKKIQNQVFIEPVPEAMIESFFSEAMGAGEIGVDFLSAQFIAELFMSEWGTELLILENHAELDNLNYMVEQLRNGNASAFELKTLNKFIIDRKITTSNNMIESLGLNQAGIIEHLGNIRCAIAESSVF